MTRNLVPDSARDMAHDMAISSMACSMVCSIKEAPGNEMVTKC
ncbi:hypothetical protein [Ammoniphilus sp. YIM 78166]|nr:hypothetical protein [Ammoniphilus sp. YIM 78166]